MITVSILSTRTITEQLMTAVGIFIMYKIFNNLINYIIL